MAMYFVTDSCKNNTLFINKYRYIAICINMHTNMNGIMLHDTYVGFCKCVPIFLWTIDIWVAPKQIAFWP